tara:strand:+ start:399 stop:2762 length:2364 start_codon:yes stop_codon:yes gene_type:complete
MRLFIIIVLFFNYAASKDVLGANQILRSQNMDALNLIGNIESSIRIPSDSNTIWLEDFENNISDWRIDNGWELTQESSYSPTHSFHMDDDNYGISSSILSPIISLPSLNEDNEILKLNFALWVDLPDWNGDQDGSADDYYRIDIANLTDAPIHFNRSSVDAYEGQSWWCSNPAIGGYLDAWVQVLQSPIITIPEEGTLSAMMQWGIEEYSGASVAGTCTDGWDAANVRISNDDGLTWNILNGDDPYDFAYGYGWIHNDIDYDCGGALEQVAAGWGGQADWHEVNFDLSDYAGQDVLIRFAFGSDPAYSTPDDVSLTGLRVDEIKIIDGSGDITFIDNADDQSNMIPMNGIEFTWEQYFIDWGAPNRPGTLGWEEYPSGAPLNGNAQLDISEHAGDDIIIRFKGVMDDNDDGGNGNGLFIDDVHIWSTMLSDIPLINGLYISNFENYFELTWDMPPTGSYDEEECSYADGSFEAVQTMIDGTSLLGEYFDMPYGIEQVNANSCSIWGSPGYGGYTTLKGFGVQLGSPQNESMYSMQILLQEGQWNHFDLDWTFDGDFILAVQISTTVGIGIDTQSTPSQNSWVNNAGWDRWKNVSSQSNGLPDGEFGINANVTTNGEGITPHFNIYRSVNNDIFEIINNGLNIANNQLIDNTVESENEYCYQVTSVYNGEEGGPAAPVCAIPGVLKVADHAETIPSHFELKQNHPNPFNPYTTIGFSMISGGYVQISIYDLKGRKVLELIDEYIELGSHSITIDSRGLSSGMYFYNFQVRDSDQNYIFYATKKMALIK